MPDAVKPGFDCLRAAWRQHWKGGLFLFIATLVAFGPSLTGGFVLDDALHITENPLLTAPDGLRRIWFTFESPIQYFPLTFTTFYFERALWGLNPAGYHLVNILIHAANVLLLWWLLTQLRVPGAWLAAAIFALHPVQVESVAWISERKNVLMGFFFLLALLAWLQSLDGPPKHQWRFYGLTVLLYGLALTAKTTACTLPPALLLILWLKKMPITRQRLAQVVPFIVMGIAMGVISMLWEHQHRGSSGKELEIGLVERGLIACRALWFYAGKLLWPTNLVVEYPRWTISHSDPRAYGWVLATALAGLGIFKTRRWAGRSVEVGVIFFVATLSPMLGIIMHYMYVYSFVADHFQYLACIGLIALAAAGITVGLSRVEAGKRIILPIANAALLITLGILTWNQCGMYANAETLWQKTLVVNPASVMANGGLGSIALEKGELEEAIDHYKKALSRWER